MPSVLQVEVRSTRSAWGFVSSCSYLVLHRKKSRLPADYLLKGASDRPASAGVTRRTQIDGLISRPGVANTSTVRCCSYSSRRVSLEPHRNSTASIGEVKRKRIVYIATSADGYILENSITGTQNLRRDPLAAFGGGSPSRGGDYVLITQGISLPLVRWRRERSERGGRSH